MQTTTLAALIVFGLGTPAIAAGTIPEEYQGVWAAAKDCRENFQNVLSNAVDREFAACGVMQVVASGHAQSNTSTIYLNCKGSQRREIWHAENIEGTDYLVIVQFEQGTEVEDSRLTCISGAPTYHLAKSRSAKFLAIRSQIRRRNKRSRHRRVPLKLSDRAQFHIRAQTACESTVLNKRVHRAMRNSEKRTSTWSDHFTVTVMTSDLIDGWNGRCDQSPNTS